MLPPFYYKGISDDGLFAAYAEIVERVADPRLRVVLYHIPQFSAVPITFPVIERLRGPLSGATFVGIKDSSGDLANMTALVERFPGFSVLAGADPLMLPLLRKGGAGCITATSNLVSSDLAFIYRNFADPARPRRCDAAQAAGRRRAHPRLAIRPDRLDQDAGRPQHRPPRLEQPAAAAAAADRDRIRRNCNEQQIPGGNTMAEFGTIDTAIIVAMVVAAISCSRSWLTLRLRSKTNGAVHDRVARPAGRGRRRADDVASSSAPNPPSARRRKRSTPASPPPGR